MAAKRSKTAPRTDRRSLHHSAVGRHITTKVPKISGDMRVIEAFHYLQKRADRFDSITYLYIVDDNLVLKGVVSIGQLLQAAPDTEIKSIMQRSVVSVRPEVDREIAAQVALQHQLKALPVTEASGELIGILQNDELLSILHHEHREDLLRFSGIIPSAAVSTSVEETAFTHSVLSRTPWILAGLGGGLVLASVMGMFESSLAKDVLLVGFLPLIVYIANAVGVQSQTLYIRDLVINKTIRTAHFLLRQLLETLIIGIISWIGVLLLSLLVWGNLTLGVVVGLSMLSAMLMATTQSILIPWLLARLHQDPAVGSGPFATILQDMTSVLIYLSIIHFLM